MWRFFKDFIIYGFSSIIGKIAAIFLIPIYTSILTKEEYGAMALIMSCYGIIDIVANLNIHSGIARDYYEEGINREKLLSTGFYSILCISILTTIILVLFKTSIFYHLLGLKEEFYNSFIVMLFTVPVTCLHTYFAILTRYKRKPILYSIGTIISTILSIGITIYGVVYLRAGVISYFIASFVSGLLSTLYFYFINKEFIKFLYSKDYIQRALKFSLPTLPAILAGWIDNSLGQVLIGKHISLSVLGVYSIAISLSSVFTLITTAFMNVWTPFLYENYKKDNFNKTINNLFVLFGTFLIVISVTLSLFSKEIICLLTNSSYMDASNYITLLCIPMCFYLLFPFASSGVSIYRETKHIGVSYVLGSVLNLSVLFITIRYYGAIAVPICLGLSRIFTYFYLYRKSQHRISYNLPNFILIIFIFIQLMCFALLNCNIYLRALFAIVTYSCIISYISRYVNVKNLLLAIRKK